MLKTIKNFAPGSQGKGGLSFQGQHDRLSLSCRTPPPPGDSTAECFSLEVCVCPPTSLRRKPFEDAHRLLHRSNSSSGDSGGKTGWLRVQLSFMWTLSLHVTSLDLFLVTTGRQADDRNRDLYS